ncbi:GNAT family N-acetyltransferase [Spongisporangium articulatum]|uniref:GNAT family N-acetyltransferase n=1 Tax=Spongisporangium articulatum TaxID=3362603 RepID=A0ABW8AK13_9ACTN
MGVEVARVDPADDDARRCLSTYYAELAVRFDAGFDPTRQGVDDDAMRPPLGLLLLARLDGPAVACGALLFKAGLAKVKRMWVDPTVRGRGVGRTLLNALEAEAAAAGYDRVGLETNSALPEAISMYLNSGYVEVEPFDDEPYAERWFVKRLSA